MKNQRRFVIILVLVLLVVIFALQNSQAVTVNLFWTHFSWPLIIVIVGSLLLGALITLLLSAASIATARKTTQKLQDEVNRLRSQPKKAKDVIETDTDKK
ncbi:lipopolysaccharide assembly protein LapA domain-containing protein [Lacticaseibacillus hulanensis]|uniref:lipopolysaccharide assembly protein LapA domain-containing protein n=1 Tax=Lacticaseibacillus hulanensis TaxID=2493111 RepID=UPI0013E28FE3|nr:lipopolysaccharide assembly protein LapA domain-containing protein [Lacticaseibacillus hulanensis]